MKKILIRYNNRQVPAFLLALFDTVDNEFASVKGWFGRTKNVFTPTRRQYCLVFIPWKHEVKELALISASDVITIDELTGNDIVSVEKYISPFTEEAPYYAEYEISNFIGYKFVYEYRSYIADIKNQCFSKPLEILYEHHPTLLNEE